MIPFIDLQAQRARIAERIDAAVLEVVAGGRYILGPQVTEFERKLAAYAGAKHCVSCANGTDALVLPLYAWGVGEGDAVFCPSFTFVATAEIVPWTGATPVFVDIDRETYNLDPEKLDAAITQVKAEGRLTPKVVIAVDLFGQPADYPNIAEVARKHGLKLIADSAQGFGCTLGGKHPQHWADVTTTSFFPAKPLGAYGDGGAVLTDDDALQDAMVSLRVHGQASARDMEERRFTHEAKYLNVRIGMNSRLDTMQAAILLEKLAIFDEEIEARNRVAARYNELLAPHVTAVPKVIDGGVSIWAQYTIEHRDRDGLAAHLKGAGVPTAVYYPIPIHQQPAYDGYPQGAGGLPVTEDVSQRVISLPMHAYLDEATQDRIVDAVRGYNR
ncbi:MAG TPA: DegT/DnrJ/EryC1/StrS aminotransferase family protein [Caulobacteraceae bacterium]|jgi:dTDP-4-amino-4,6-dideoxygalactose transaminase